MTSRRRRAGPLPPALQGDKRVRRRVELLGAVAMGAFMLVIVAAFLFSGLQRSMMGSSQVAAVVSAVLVDLANGDRTQNGVGELKVNPVLVAAAQAKANDMAEKGYFAHISPDGVDPWHWFKQVGYNFTYAGENLAIDFSDSSDVNTAWMNSPEHRKNLLNPKFTEIGIATAQGMYEGRETTFVVQEFGAPSDSVASQTQAPLKQTVVPKAATEPALASVEDSGLQVLGSAAAQSSVSSGATATTEPAVAAVLAADASADAPFWSFLVAFPRDTLRYIYYSLGALILIALAFETGFEFHSRHRKHALKAGTLLIAMVVLFVLANALFFSQPVLAATVGLL